MHKASASLLLFCAVLLALLGTTAARADEPTTQARNKAVAIRVFEENFNQGRFQVAQEIYDPGFKNHGLTRDFDLKRDQDAVHDEKHAFPDLHMTVDMLVAEGDLVTAVWTFEGTHTESGYGGLPATGARIRMRGITVWRIIDGKIRDEWTAFDDLDAYGQVVAHRKWTLVGLGLGLLLVVVASERVVVYLARKAWLSLRRPRIDRHDPTGAATDG